MSPHVDSQLRDEIMFVKQWMDGQQKIFLTTKLWWKCASEFYFDIDIFFGDFNYTDPG
jgi:hypothetical protein